MLQTASTVSSGSTTCHNRNARKGGRFSSSLAVEEKLKLIEESKQPGFTVERAAAEYGISKPTVYKIIGSSSESSSSVVKKYRKRKLEQTPGLVTNVIVLLCLLFIALTGLTVQPCRRAEASAFPS